MASYAVQVQPFADFACSLHRQSVHCRAHTTTVRGSQHCVHVGISHLPKMANVEGALVGLGNPLLDISAVVDQAFLDKYEVRCRHCTSI